MTTLADFLLRHDEVARLHLTRVRGSSPREAGTVMFVSRDGCFGTIGGGQLEYMMIDAARAMLAAGKDARDCDVPLGPEIGQCCGGRVEVAITRMDQAARDAALREAADEIAAQPRVYILGAGHVGRALAGLLAQMPVRAVLADSRAEALALCHAPVERRLTPLPETLIEAAPGGSAFVVLTHDHALDFLLAAQALARGDAGYVGMIGSATKRAKFRSWCRDHGGAPDTSGLICPIGAGGGTDKRPAVIAAFVAAEIMAALTAGTVAGARDSAETRLFAAPKNTGAT